MSLTRFGLLAVALVCAAGCKNTKLSGSGCQKDSDCGEPAAAFRCETQTGVCYCRTNDACPPAQFCNTAGFCQDRQGCETNADCLDSSLFCDTSAGTCLSLGRCTTDLHCALGQVCDTKKTTCVDGCRKDGDCPGTSCRCGDAPCACTGSTPEELARCALGTCDPTFCSTPDFCRFGETCSVIPDGGVPYAQCHDDYDPVRRPYCDNCTYGGGVSICGKGPNYCLIDTRHPGGSFCGTDCSQGQSCPRGYACQDVIVVMSQWQCSLANPSCPTNPTLPCATDAECKHGGHCAKAPGMPNGTCAGACAVDEGDSTGFCTCQVDADCAQETCNLGECSISRRPCTQASDCQQHPIRCVDFAGGGGCLIGQNCAPTSGLSCLEVK